MLLHADTARREILDRLAESYARRIVPPERQKQLELAALEAARHVRIWLDYNDVARAIAKSDDFAMDEELAERVADALRAELGADFGTRLLELRASDAVSELSGIIVWNAVRRAERDIARQLGLPVPIDTGWDPGRDVPPSQRRLQ